MKRSNIIKAICIAPALLAGTYCLAQSNTEQQLKTYTDQIHYWRYQYSPEDSGVNPNANAKDSLVAANAMLERYISSSAATLNNVPEDITVAVSDDKKVKLFSWDTETGNASHIYNTVIASGNQGYTMNSLPEVKNTPLQNGAHFTDVYDFEAHDNTKIYVAIFSRMNSEKDAAKGAIAFKVTGGQVQAVQVFPGNAAVIDYAYDYFSNYDYKKMKEKYVPYFSKQKLYIPVTDGDKLNGGWNVYTFDGGQFSVEKSK